MPETVGADVDAGRDGDAVPDAPIATVGGEEADATPLLLSHYNVQPVFDVYANVQGTDLGSVSSQVNRIIADHPSPQQRRTDVLPPVPL